MTWGDSYEQIAAQTPGDDDIDVSVTIEFHLRKFISHRDLGEMGKTLNSFVEQWLRKEGIASALDGPIPGPDAHVLEVKEWTS